MSLNSRDKNGSCDRPFVLGLTGGIGTGKSTAALYIAGKGFDHVDADEISRDLTGKGNPVLAEIDREFGHLAGEGGTVLLPDGSLNRKALADLVFSDPALKEKLDRIMFERIVRRIEDRILRAEGPVLIDAPLLFEAGLDRICDRVLLITCDLETRLERVLERDGVSREDVLARIRNQMPDEEKMERADFVVDNSGSVEELEEKLGLIISQLSC